MSKELEALKEIFNGMYNKQGFIKEFKAIEQALTDLEKYLTPPTVDEVCKALSEYLKQDVKFSKEKSFYYSTNSHYGEIDEHICGYGWEHNHHTLEFEINLPPHLITLIGRFYQSLEDELK